MKVIKHGNTYKETECVKCNAILAYCNTDIKTSNMSDGEYFGEYHYSYKKYVVCPECNSDIIISWVIDGEEQI